MTHTGDEKTLYLVDGTAQLFRAYFAIRSLTNDEGLPTNAVYGFTTMLRKLLKEEQPPFVAVAFDLGGKVFRHATYPDYKANRPPVPEDLRVQVPYAKEACEVLGVRTVELAGFEADDLIATYARKARDRGLRVVVVASDKDLLQLVGPGVAVFNPSKESRLDADAVTRSFGVAPGRVRDVLGLMGDTVDNIPGVPGVGGKTARSVVSTYGDLEDVIARAARLKALFESRDELASAVQGVESSTSGPQELATLSRTRASFLDMLQEFGESESDPGVRERMESLRDRITEQAPDSGAASPIESELRKQLRQLKKELKSMDRGSSRRVWLAIHEHAEQARMSKQLATLCDDAPVEFDAAGFRYDGPDVDRALTFFEALGFRTLLPEFGADAEPRPGVSSAAAEPPLARGIYETVLTAERLSRVAAEARAAGRLALDTETDDLDPLRAGLVGLSLSWEEGRAVYVPVRHDYPGAPEQLVLDEIRGTLGPLLADPSVAKIGQNLIYDSHVLRRHDLHVAGWELDTMVAAFLLNPGRASYSMDSLAEQYLGYTPIPYHEVAGSGAKQTTLNLVDLDRVTEYAAEDADVTLRLANHFSELLEQAGLRDLYDRIDGPLLPVLTKMEARGIRVDVAMLGSMSGQMETALTRARGEIHALAGSEFNVDSPKQLREVLFDHLGLRPKRKTAKSRVASTDAQTLEELGGEHPIARKILEYRELAKLKGTYVDALPRLVNPETGRVHTSYNPTGAATGRLSSSDPNLQNIPARTEAGRRIRSAFVPQAGYEFLSSDYSQIELRILAHLAEDEELIAAFRVGEDIHRYTASRVFGVNVDLVTDAMRRRAKAINFGILYGMSETRLAREQGIPRGEARRFIRAYFERFSGVRTYIDQVREQALRDAAVHTLFGRVRFFPQLHQRVNRAVQEQALRAAVNTTIQGTAADLMKLAMLKVDGEIDKQRLDARILLQVHDELLLEVARADMQRTGGVVRAAMEQVHRLAVPLLVDQKVGDSWLTVT